MRISHLFLVLVAGLAMACGAGSVAALEQDVQRESAVLEDGGVSPFQASLSFKSPEASAIQEVPFQADPEARRRFESALSRYRNEWMLLLTIGPRPGTHSDPLRPLALDIENNGGMWGDHERNLKRLMFEMGDFIRLRTSEGKEVEPSLVEFQRAFGMGKDRQFLIVFPRVFEGKPLAPPFDVVVKEFGQGTGTLRFAMKRGPSSMALWRARRLWKLNSENSGSTSTP